MRDFLNNIKRYVTPCNTVIIIITILCFIAQNIAEAVSGEYDTTIMFSLAWWKVFDDHEYYRLITYMLLHGSISHIFNNMLILGFVGSVVERILGRVRYLFTYIGTGIVAGLGSAAYNRWCYNNLASDGGFYTYSIGASGAVFGITGALLWILLINRGHVAGISLRQIILFTFLSIYGGFTSTGIDNIAHVAGALFGIVSAMILYDRRGGYA